MTKPTRSSLYGFDAARDLLFQSALDESERVMSQFVAQYVIPSLIDEDRRLGEMLTREYSMPVEYGLVSDWS